MYCLGLMTGIVLGFAAVIVLASYCLRNKSKAPTFEDVFRDSRRDQAEREMMIRARFEDDCC
jgi:hypothetical protein